MYFVLGSQCLFLLLEAVMVFLLLRRKVWRAFPLFSIYLVFLLVSNAFMDWAFGLAQVNFVHYTRFYLIDVVIDWTAVFLVLIEIGVSALKSCSYPVQSLRWMVAAGLGTLALLSWPIARYSLPSSYSLQADLVLQMQLVMAMCSLASLISLEVITRSLSIRWGGLGKQASLGFVAYDVVHIILTVIWLHLQLGGSFEAFAYTAESLNYFVILLYWIVCLSRYKGVRYADEQIL
jgi:hypothetical protein